MIEITECRTSGVSFAGSPWEYASHFVREMHRTCVPLTWSLPADSPLDSPLEAMGRRYDAQHGDHNTPYYHRDEMRRYQTVPPPQHVVAFLEDYHAYHDPIDAAYRAWDVAYHERRAIVSSICDRHAQPGFRRDSWGQYIPPHTQDGMAAVRADIAALGPEPTPPGIAKVSSITVDRDGIIHWMDSTWSS